MKVCSVVGARPQFVKAGVVARALRDVGGTHEVMIHTGQHYDRNMSAVFFDELDLPHPKYNLGVGSATHGVQTAKMLVGLEEIFVAEQPDVVVVFGDTNSTLAAAISASKLHLPVAHVEAGLRSFNRSMPEEINRLVADTVSDLLFAPSEHARAQLLSEGHSDARVLVSGDVMFDATLLAAERARDVSDVQHRLKIEADQYFLATFHRAENTDDPARLRAIAHTLLELANVAPVVLPLHPRTRAALKRDALLERVEAGLLVCEPLGYVDILRLIMDARAVVTDSGGLQKEAFFVGVRCFVLRDETEWTELVAAGWNRLVPPGDANTMTAKILDASPWSPVPIRPYGDGNASALIAHALKDRYGSD